MKTLFVILTTCACAVAAAQASAQTFPSRTIRIIVPSVAGSSPDIRARQIAPKLSEAFGQPVIVDNRPGANGLIAARETVKAPADGHTLFLALINNAVGDLLATDTCCRLNEELIPVSRFSMTPLLTVVNPSVPARTFKEFLDLARAKPDSLSYAAHGPGAISQLVGAMVKMELGARLLEVPYKGVNSEIPDLQGGQLSTAYVVPQVVTAAIRSGKLRALAVMGPERLPILPEVPSVAELGMPQLEAIAWNGIVVAAGTPPSVVQALHRELVTAYTAPDVKEQLRNGGAYAAADTPEQFGAFIRAEKEKWGRVIREAGIRAQ
ncbi:MAG TPA: tripartite tricarboxylate transporter substrate binding protein [Burkholderiales bacterium]|nr:tripartite tricarboxylate transporter substrate binding protein [Burkholderiales bacterium]